MYLCVCHALNDRRVREAVENGGGTVGSVFRSLGIKPRCTRCLPFIKSTVKAVRQEGVAPEPGVSMAPAE